MRNIEDSEWLKEPRLEVVESDDDDGVRRSRFSVSATQVTTEEKIEAMETVAREAQP
jgi:Tfp pilus assembly protein PilN